MSTRLKVRLAAAAIGLVIYFIFQMVHPNRVTFSPANLSIDPGKGWKVLKVPATLPACTPRLVGKAGMINAVLLDEEATDAKAAAAKFQANLMATGKVSAEMFTQEDFTTAAGYPAVHFVYTAKSTNSDTPEVRSHHFITRNMRGRCVSISYITSPAAESPAVLEAIRKTLRVE